VIDAGCPLLARFETCRLHRAVPRAVVPILPEPLIASFCRAYHEV
jgi:hypothetical protein